MRSRMHPRYYLSQEIFDREQCKIFRKVWLFAGLKSLLPKNNSFITRKISGIPVVIQNFNGTLRAFENVCLHRSAPLQNGFTGCRPLVCSYHAWSYDQDGRVKKIPDCEAIYRIGNDELRGLKLREFAIETIGGLVFINLSEQPLPIGEQFSQEFIASLESSSNAYDGEVIVTTRHCNFNWKLVYENLRDFNHVRYLHARSLAGNVSFQSGTVDATEAARTVDPLEDTSVAGLRREMRSFSYGGPEGEFERVRHFPWMDSVERWGDVDAYFNWLPFPNLHIASGNGGHSFTLEHHIPIAPGKTDLEIYFVTARKKKPYLASAQVLLASMHGSNLVLGEDVAQMEAIQSVLHESAPLPNQGAYEITNRRVERWYTTLMDTDHAI